MQETDRSWMIGDTPVFFDVKYPSADTFEGVLDGAPFDISRNSTPHWVVRIKDMDSRYRKKTGCKVVSVADIANIRKRSIPNE